MTEEYAISTGAGVRKTDDLMPWMEQIIATVRVSCR